MFALRDHRVNSARTDLPARFLMIWTRADPSACCALSLTGWWAKAGGGGESGHMGNAADTARGGDDISELNIAARQTRDQ